MYIKEIEFVNFKSFGKKVKISFYNDFTTISGPNGSGKSNIIDGILFALGLTSSRTLRAEKLTDLIYNGEEAKNLILPKLQFVLTIPTASYLWNLTKLRSQERSGGLKADTIATFTSMEEM